MSSEELKQYVAKKIYSKAAELGEPMVEIPDDFDLTGSGIFDSMDFMDLLVSIEDKFSIEIDLSDADPDQFTKFAGFINAIVRK